MKHVLLVASLCACALVSLAQNGTHKAPVGGGPRVNQPGDELTPGQRLQILTMLQQNVTQLGLRHMLPSPNARTTQVAFGWPVRQANGFSDNGYYGVSNYVDHHTAINTVQDYNCGTRSYDLASGYNHHGTDIFSWPYAWQKMSQNAVEVVSAAEGTIIGKTDGDADRNCNFCATACNWNAVYLQHTDGSVTWYGHLKAGSLTDKEVGQVVAAGEYLGVVGSSGNSTGPHLHFEVYTDNTCTTLVDPWAGGCNSTSRWAAQQAYRVPTVNKVMTHSQVPVMGLCAADEQPNPNRNFAPGGTIHLSAYYRDNINATTAVHRIFRPDGSVWSSWTQPFTTEYDASWWYYTVTLPVSGTYYGVWRYEVTYNGQAASATFAIGMTLPVDVSSFTATAKQEKAILAWTTAGEAGLNGFVVERSADGNGFERIGFVAAKNTGERTAYSFVDAQPGPGKTFYRLRMLHDNGSDR